ncbi:MAG: copper chaperone PCu(A)C [Gammaproteobacteria bacterium]|jgi:copper(I)-binding protein|nr:copper chaperone PCu(A)C [Gammaproteobacteria bacterium]
MAFMSGIDPSRDTQGELEIIGATIPLAPANASVNAGYVKFTNTSDKDVEFHNFTSPVYDSVEMHITENRSGSAKMKQVSKILIPANSSVELKPGGAHLMLIGPRRDVQAGEQILMIAQDSLERRFMLKFTVIDMRQETSHNDHNHHNHNH